MLFISYNFALQQRSLLQKQRSELCNLTAKKIPSPQLRPAGQRCGEALSKSP